MTERDSLASAMASLGDTTRGDPKRAQAEWCRERRYLPEPWRRAGQAFRARRSTAAEST